MNYFTKIISIFILTHILSAQIIQEQMLFDEDGNQVDIFAYQIPENYNPDSLHALLIGFHQWGGNQMTPFNTDFDEHANSNNWFFMSPYGGSSNNYNHQNAQKWVKEAIIWMQENYSIDNRRIYMVGGSMGGASGSIYANNHLNPTEPMIAATASASGILDCERRAIEMDGNNSMTEWFGGNYDEVPFEYHRNSAIYFADSTQSMHYNLKYTPIYFDFGVTEPHRTHAEEMHQIMLNYNQNLWIDENPQGSHGFSVFDEEHVCNWLSQFTLQDNPDTINVNLDEPSRAYWIEAFNQTQIDNFIRINVIKNYGEYTYGLDEFTETETWEGYGFSLNQYSNSDSLILHILNEEFINNNDITFYMDLGENNIGITGPLFNGSNLENINAFIIYENDFSDDPNCNEFEFYTDGNNVIWIQRTTDILEGEICYSEQPYKITFTFLLNDEFDDVNQDGIWNILDIVLIINHIMNINELTNFQTENADVNNDGLVDILDIVNIVNIIISR